MSDWFPKFILPVVCGLLLAQANTPQKDAQVPDKPQYQLLGRNCESNADTLHHLAIYASENKDRMFVIARVGKSENQRNLNWRRLHNVREFFRSNTGFFNLGNLVLAEGEPVKGPGQVEFYLGSQLYAKATFGRGEDFCVDCCEWPDYRYYGRGKSKSDRRYKAK